MAFAWLGNLFGGGHLKKLRRRVAPFTHPQHPFLDKDYSPSSRMPAADYTDWVAARLSKKDWTSIRDLLTHLNDSATITALERSLRRYAPPEFLICKPALLHEIRAVNLLCLRIPLIGHASNRSHLSRDLLAHVLSCHPFEMRPTEKHKSVVSHSPGALSLSLARYPVTFRSALAAGMLPDGDYLLRQYGLSSAENERWLDETGIHFSRRDKIIPGPVVEWLAEVEKMRGAARRL